MDKRYNKHQTREKGGGHGWSKKLQPIYERRKFRRSRPKEDTKKKKKGATSPTKKKKTGPRSGRTGKQKKSGEHEKNRTFSKLELFRPIAQPTRGKTEGGDKKKHGFFDTEAARPSYRQMKNGKRPHHSSKKASTTLWRIQKKKKGPDFLGTQRRAHVEGQTAERLSSFRRTRRRKSSSFSEKISASTPTKTGKDKRPYTSLARQGTNEKKKRGKEAPYLTLPEKRQFQDPGKVKK